MTSPPILRVVLTGFMGAGKTTVGRLLAPALGWQFLDLDDVLVHSHASSIPELFATHGEVGFRALEAQAFHRCLAHERTVLALGGGALEWEPTRTLLFDLPHTHIVFLEVPLALSIARCQRQGGGEARPVLADPAHLAERYAQRLPHYRRAHVSLDTTAAEPQQILRRLLDSLPPHAV